MKFTLNSRMLVSETSLPQKIIKEWDGDIIMCNIVEDYLSISECESIVESFKNNLDQEAKRIFKSIKGRVEGIDMDIMYSNMADVDWHQAALIVEIFRNPAISKNAGNLDTKKLQKKIYASLRNDSIVFFIGWGQSKRYCGGLKTEGYSSDFSELYSIMMLYIIMRSIYIVCHKKVTLNVITGGSRFYPALFTDPEEINKYDVQRQSIANVFSTEYTDMKFIAYHDSIDNDNAILDDFCQVVEPAEIDKNFKTVLMNVDWYAILTNLKKLPHGIGIPPPIDKYIKNGGDVSMLIRMAIVSILNREAHSYWIEKIGDLELFDEVIDFFYEVSRESTKKYLAINLMNTDMDAMMQGELYTGGIRLTVHEKIDQGDIPAIFTLGIKGGNKLSQHVVSFISSDGVLFDTTFGVFIKWMDGNKEIKRVMAPEDGFFSWLNNRGQPFFYSDMSKDKYLKRLLKLKFVEN